jgi:uncharacterized membrane protein
VCRLHASMPTTAPSKRFLVGSLCVFSPRRTTTNHDHTALSFAPSSACCCSCRPPVTLVSLTLARAHICTHTLSVLSVCHTHLHPPTPTHTHTHTHTHTNTHTHKHKHKHKHTVYSLGCTILLLFLGFAYFVYGAVMSLTGIPEVVQSAAYIVPAVLLLFTVIHSFYTLGWRCFLVFVLLTLALSWAFEELGTNTVFPYASLEYSALLSTRLGSVPVEVPFSYLMVLYPALCLADVLLFGDSWRRHTLLDTSAWSLRGWLCDLLRCALTAMLMCGWLLVADPTAVNWCGLWSYAQENDSGMTMVFFGVPVVTLLGWFLVFFIITLLYLRTESWIRVRALFCWFDAVQLVCVHVW